MPKCKLCGAKSLTKQNQWIDCPGCGGTICDNCKGKAPFFEPVDAYFCSDACTSTIVEKAVAEAINTKNIAVYVEEPEAVGGTFSKVYYTPKRITVNGILLYFWLPDSQISRVPEPVRAACERFVAACEKNC